MSYLDVPRLHFFGQFTAQPSTLNNTPTNYDPANWDNLTPSWNDNGNHTFALQNCQVTSVVLPNGSASDPIVGAGLASVGRAVLVDLDTEQQLVSQIFGLTVQITLGNATITGNMTPVNFFDINFARTAIPGGMGTDGVAGAAYQSVLTNVTISGGWDSPWVTAIQESMSETGLNTLSIRFIVDAFRDQSAGPEFTLGRVTGTIGPYFPGEPETFVDARFLRPVDGLWYVPAKTDKTRNVLTMDFANAYFWFWPNWPNQNPVLAQQSFYVAIPQPAPTPPIQLGAVNWSESAYETFAAVQEFDISQQLSAIANSATAVYDASLNILVAQENPSGAFACMEPFVFRLAPGEPGSSTFYANIFEQPAAGQTLNLSLNPALLAGQLAGGPAVGTPTNGVSFPSSVTTDANGMATITVTANPNGPGNPRGYLDGQIYPIAFSWALDTNPDPNTFLSVHAYDLYTAPASPVWNDVEGLLAMYGTLYTAMNAIIDLTSYDQVSQNAGPIKDRLTRDMNDPLLMPITRELSVAKMQTIVTWIDNGTPLT